jgi:hypothetical protein
MKRQNTEKYESKWTAKIKSKFSSCLSLKMYSLRLEMKLLKTIDHRLNLPKLDSRLR